MIVKWLSEQRGDSREENEDGTISLSIAPLFGHQRRLNSRKSREST